jgi:hypothetical protein
MKHQLLAPRWRGESAALRRETGHQTSGARAERRQRRARRCHTSSRWLWITKVKLRMYVPSWTTCLRWLKVLSHGQAAGPQRGEGLWAIQYTGVWYPLRKRPGAKQRPNATENGRAERWNPPTALPATGGGGQAVCLGGKDGSRSQGLTVMVRIR